MSGSVTGNANLYTINSITQFAGGTQAVWNNLTIPPPAGVVIYAVDTTVVKMGDGVTLYSALPVIFTINSIISLSQSVGTLTSSVGTIQTTLGTLQTSLTTLSTEYTTLNTTVASLTSPPPPNITTNGGTVMVTPGVTRYFINNATPAPTTVILPTVGQSNEHHLIKDIAGNAQIGPITVTVNGTVSIDGQTSIEVLTNYGYVSVDWNGTNYSITSHT